MLGVGLRHHEEERSGARRRRHPLSSTSTIALGLALLGAAFRLVYLDAPSLWWDEFIHVHLATRPGPELFHAIKWGAVSATGGNTGSMPLDYLLLHVYARLVPLWTPAHLEAYWRLPACLYGIASVAVVTFLLARFGGRLAGALGGTLLALSVAGALYAAEVRPYSLSVLLAAVNLYTAARLARGGGDAWAWLTFAGVALLFVAASLPATLLLSAEGAVLLALAVGRGRGRAALGGLVVTAVVLAIAAATYLSGIDLTVSFGRGTRTDPTAIARTLSFLATGGYWYPQLAALLAIGSAALAIRHASRRAPEALPLITLAIASFIVLPALLLLIRWKEYYFHVRHALVLLPAFVVVVTHGVLGAADLLAGDRARRRTLLATGMVAILAGLPAIAFVRDPFSYFAWTKTVYDWKGLAARLAALPPPPGQRVLLVVEGGTREDERATYLAAWYLRTHGLAGSLVLRTTTAFQATPIVLAEAARTGTLDRLDAPAEAALGLWLPTYATEFRLRLEALAAPETLPASVAPVDGPYPVPFVAPVLPGRPPVSIVRYALLAFRSPPAAPDLRPLPFRGFVLLEPGAM